jgi:ABC-type polysaccharide/polyol phosphate export permease
MRSVAPTPVWDVVTAFRRWPFWTFLAWQDIKQRYRGSKLGPFWTVANVAIVAAGIGVLYAAIFNQPTDTYIPFLTAGVVTWFFVANSISDATQAFQQAAMMIRQAALPVFAFPLRVVTRNLIVMGHNALVFVVVCLLFRNMPNLLWLIPGLLLVIVNVLWVTVLSALLGARYRDAIQIIQNLLTFFLFLSPIFWPPEQAGERAEMVRYNPIHHLIEVARAPALGEAPQMESVWVCLAMAVVGWIVALAAFLRFRHRIVHWL